MVGERQLRVLVDTNVWLDVAEPNRSGRLVARRLLSRCRADDIALLYPPHAPQDVFYQVTLDAKRWVRSERGTITEEWAHAINEQAWEAVRTMRELGTVVGMNEADLWLACKYKGLNSDFEDNLVLAAANRVQADYLVTSDRQLIAKSTVAALTPQDMLAVLEAGEA